MTRQNKVKWIINRFIMLSVALHQRSAIAKLKKNKIINESVVYYKNDNFQEEVWLDKNLKPHFKSLQFHGITISNFGMPVTTQEKDFIVENKNKLEDVNREIENINKEFKDMNWFEKLTGISIRIERAKK